MLARPKVRQMIFKHWGVNPTIDTAQTQLSTFGADLDTASFAIARGYLDRGQLPPEAAIRTEEFVNAFSYGYRPPRRSALAASVELVPSPNRRGYHVLRIGLTARAPTRRRDPIHLLLLVDTSAAMARKGRLHQVRRALRLGTSKLLPADRVTIISFADRARVALRATPGSRRATIAAAIGGLTPAGGSNLIAGLKLAFRLATRAPARRRRMVVICSDGVTSRGASATRAALRAASALLSKEVALLAVGFGMGFYDDRLMEQIARLVGGRYRYVDSAREARRVFGDELLASARLEALDIILQLRFRRRAVSRFRLLGYEGRLLKHRQLRLGGRAQASGLAAGESLTALYEVKLRPSGSVLGELRVRYRLPRPRAGAGGTKSLRLTLGRASVLSSLSRASPSTRLAVVAAGFAEKLRSSYWARNLTYGRLRAMLRSIRPTSSMSSRAELAALEKLIRAAEGLDRRGDRYARHLPLSRMTFDRVPVRR